MAMHRNLTLLLAAASLGLAGCASSGPAVEADVPAPVPPRSEPAGDAAQLARLETIYRERQAARLADVSEADVAFVSGMIHHHAQALVMSRLAPGNGASSSIQTLAARIINAQKDEITNMQRWLADRDRPVPAVADDGTVTLHVAGEHAGMGHEGMEHGGMDHSGMPGMLSPAQLAELAAARGGDYDRLFLTYMIQHHQGAVTMVHELFAIDGAAQDDLIFKLASDIQVDQITEIHRMQRMLDALPPSDSSRE